MANCGECINLDWDNKERWTSLERYYCKEGHGYREPTERQCSYDFVYNKNCDQEPNKGYQPAGCYITTIVCHCLGYADDCELLTILRNFRDHYLKTHLQYLNILLQYDLIGPKISKEISNIAENYGFCLNMMNNFLIPCANAIKQEKYEEAITIYENMVYLLSETFNIPSINIPANLEYDINIIGKGRLKTKSAN